MKFPILLIFGLVLALFLAACGTSAMASPTSEPRSVQDQASLVRMLQSAGVTVETGESLTQEFFSVEGKILKVNGTDLQVFEYENAEAMEADASKVAPDGGSIGTAMIDWIDMPHFYKAGRMIVLYVGNDQTILDLLEQVLGPQFAGR